MTTVKQKEKLNIQINLEPFLLFVLTSILIHGVGLLILVFSNRSQPTAHQKTESTPIEFIVVPPEESPEEPPPDTERRAINNSIAKGKVEPKLPSATDKIGNETAIAIPKSRPNTLTEKQEVPLVPNVSQTRLLSKLKPIPKPLPSLPKRPKPTNIPTSRAEKVRPIPPVPPKLQPIKKNPTVSPSPLLTKVPKPAIAPSKSLPSTPPVEEIKPTPQMVPKPQPIEKTPLLSRVNSTSIPRPKPAPLLEKIPSKEIEAAIPKLDSSPVATNLPPKPQPIEPSSPTKPSPIPATKPNLSSEQNTSVGSGSASLLGGTYRKSLSEDAGNSFFNPQANASQQALNSSGLDARKDLNLGPYFAEIRRRVKRNWQPSSPGNNRQTILVFSIQRNGQITGLRVRRSSGSEKIDRESLAAVQKSGPFGALPANFPNPQLDVEFNFNIYVNQRGFTPQLENWQRF